MKTRSRELQRSTLFNKFFICTRNPCRLFSPSLLFALLPKEKHIIPLARVTRCSRASMIMLRVMLQLRVLGSLLVCPLYHIFYKALRIRESALVVRLHCSCQCACVWALVAIWAVTCSADIRRSLPWREHRFGRHICSLLALLIFVNHRLPILPIQRSFDLICSDSVWSVVSSISKATMLD